MTLHDTTHLKIGALIFPQMDQCDFTGPYEALARVPNSTFFTIWKNMELVPDVAGMRLLADTALDDAPQLDVLPVPGGRGQEALMHDKQVLSFIRRQPVGRVTYSRSAPGHCCAALLACCMASAPLPTGRRWISFHSTERYRAWNA